MRLRNGVWFVSLIWRKSKICSPVSSLANSTANVTHCQLALHIVLSGEFSQTNQLLSNAFLKTTESLSRGFLETNQRLTDLQLSEIIDFVEIATVTDPDIILTLCLSLMARRRYKQTQSTQQYTWLTPQLTDWSRSDWSAIVMIRGNFRARLNMKDLAAEIVQCLQGAGAQVVWALRKPETAPGRPERPFLIEVLKYLTWQLLRLPEVSSSGIQLTCLHVKAAKTEDEWLSILGSILEKMRRVHIVLDIEAIDYGGLKNGGDFWPRTFLELFRELKNRGAQTTVKVLLVAYSSSLSPPTLSDGAPSKSFSVVKMPRSELQHQMRPHRSPMRPRGRLVQRASRGTRNTWTQGWAIE